MTIPNPRTLDSLDGRIILALDKDPEASALALSRTLGVARNTSTPGWRGSSAAAPSAPSAAGWTPPRWAMT